jgi:hypothetical protein
MHSKNHRGRPALRGRPQSSAGWLARFAAAAEIDPFAEDHVATGSKNDGAPHVARCAAQGKGRVAILPNGGDGDAHATGN